MRYYFGKEAAEQLIGQRVRSVAEFRGVPEGTTGKVVRADALMGGDYTVGVEWDLPALGKARPVDSFSRDEYYKYLEEVIQSDREWEHEQGLKEKGP
jgi:hypothetical protein